MFYVTGSGTECIYPPQPLDKNVQIREVSHLIEGNVSHERYEISEDLYKYLKEKLKDRVAINEEENATFVIEGSRK